MMRLTGFKPLSSSLSFLKVESVGENRRQKRNQTAKSDQELKCFAIL